MCTYREPEFKFVPSSHSWIEGYISRKVRLMITNLRPVEATTAKVNNTRIEAAILNLKSINNDNAFDQNTTLAATLTPRKLENVTQTLDKVSLKVKEMVNKSRKFMLEMGISVNSRKEIEEEKVVNSSETVQKNIVDVGKEFVDLDQISQEMIEQNHVLQKREAKWKAYRFDASALGIVDPWAGRNLWFQQLTHSVRSIKKLKGPCVLKVPEPLTTSCQSSVLSWLLYQQQSSVDKVMALSVNLFKPRLNCSWLAGLPYVNLFEQHENVTTAVPDPMEVKPVRAKYCFCSNETNKGSGMFMGISECDGYMMDLGKREDEDVNKLYEVIFQVSVVSFLRQCC
ncbi:uncharacterized protein LOC119486725 [Sebastes umbrosus]|uniref:uncharacterized protein LOC119486725 n=1 Tax=Sebastes umbrosus TaxID=72105 RepID=UPI00189F9A18|nr:uncharacterized protein LOC119486725 [Sebastes umbrosus]